MLLRVQFTQLIFLPIVLLTFVLFSPTLFAQGIGIVDGFPFTADPLDTTTSSFFPNAFDGPAGNRGFVQGDEKGNLRFDDGTQTRFVGVTVTGTACFPDSLNAIATARRLRKLGINLVRFHYMDYSYDWAAGASILDATTGFRSLQPAQTQRFDWFVYQLKQNGIYSALTLLSARAPRPEDGFKEGVLDTIPWLGQGMQYLYPEARAAHKVVSTALLEHVNPYTGTAYKDEPAIASLEVIHRRSMDYFHRIGWDFFSPASPVFSWQMVRRIDTLYSSWLKKKYGTTVNLTEAWSEAPPQGGYPNLIQQGSFEGEFQTQWTILAGGALSVFPILAQDSVPDGEFALTLRVNNTQGNVYNAYMAQTVDLKFNKLYRLRLRAKCSNPEGRTVRVLIFGAQGELSPGFNQPITINPWWEEHELTMLMPVSNTLPSSLYLYFGDVDGNLTIDDVRFEEIAPVGLLPEEGLDNSTVQRIPWGEALGLSPRRFMDQAEFYRELDRDYMNELHRFVRDTIGAQQMVAGSEHTWASELPSIVTQQDFDLGMSAQGWDFLSTEGGTWHIRNYSLLRQGWPGPIYSHAVFARKNKPLITTLAAPYPNRYQAETMIFNQAYLLLQEWDGFIFDEWDGDLADNRRDYIDSADWSSMRNNPVLSALMPSISQIIRLGLLAPARNTVRIQHTSEQFGLFPRLGAAWGQYGMPGGFPATGATISKVVVDSLDATEYTQANDFELESQVEGEVTSDTREIRWEMARGTFTLNAPSVQGATGVLNRAGGLNLDFLEINAFTLNETATVLWVPVDSARRLDKPGRSLLTILTRSEPIGWRWVDTTTASSWGNGPMLMEPARIQLEFKAGSDVKDVLIIPLDQEGKRKDGVAPLPTTRVGNDYRVTIDQGQTNAVWYSVEFVAAGSSTGETELGEQEFSVQAIPNIVGEKGTVFLTLSSPGQRAHLELHDALGRRVRVLYDGMVHQQEHRIDFSTSDLPGGTYFVKCRVNGESTSVEQVRVVR